MPRRKPAPATPELPGLDEPRVSRSLVVAGLKAAVTGAAEAYLRGLLARHGAEG